MYLHNGKTTDKLLKEALEITDKPNLREQDMLLATGEQVTISKLAICLNKLGYDSISLTGWQVPIRTNDISNNADITKDTTAVALAAALQALRCDIYTDVDGVYDKDPNTNKNAKKIEFITYDEMLKLANSGAKVLHSKCIEIGKKFNVPIYVKSSFKENDLGTFVGKI